MENMVYLVCIDIGMAEDSYGSEGQIRYVTLDKEKADKALESLISKLVEERKNEWLKLYEEHNKEYRANNSFDEYLLDSSAGYYNFKTVDDIYKLWANRYRDEAYIISAKLDADLCFTVGCYYE